MWGHTAMIMKHHILKHHVPDLPNNSSKLKYATERACDMLWMLISTSAQDKLGNLASQSVKNTPQENTTLGKRSLWSTNSGTRSHVMLLDCRARGSRRMICFSQTPPNTRLFSKLVIVNIQIVDCKNVERYFPDIEPWNPEDLYRC